MDIQIPTTTEEMINTLEEIFAFFRRERVEYEKLEFEPLTLYKMDEEAKTDEEIYSEAVLTLSASHIREIKEQKKQIEDAIFEKTQEQESLEELKQKELSLVDLEYENLEKELKKTATKNGIINSDIIKLKLFDLKKEREEQKKNIEIRYLEQETRIKEKIARLTEEKEGVEEYFRPIHLAEIETEKKKIKNEDEERVQIAVKYNSTVSEKEQKYKNKLIETEAKIKIDFLNIANKDYSKEELIQMGYYKNVIKCVCGYLNKLTPEDAYYVYKTETSLVYYLDHYYDILNSTYQMRAK